MEALIFALIATRNGYTQHETFVSEPAEFQPFDLGALRRPDSVEDNSPSRPLYSFSPPRDCEEQFLGRHVGAFLSCRRAISEITGVKGDWGPADSAQLFRMLTKRGFGYLSAAYIDSYVREHFRELI
jgi:hypothetical protein